MPDGRIREEGSDLDRHLARRGRMESVDRRTSIEFGAQAQSLDATRINRLFSANHRRPRCSNADVDTWSAAGWAQYRWTPSARFSITPGVRVERWDLIDTTKASPWLLAEFEIRSGHARAVRRRRAAPGADHRSDAVRRSRARSWCRSGRRPSKRGLEQRIGRALARVGIGVPPP